MVPRTKCFPDGEVFVEVGEAVRGCEVFIVQPTSPPVNEHLVDLLAMADACRRASAEKIIAVIPYFGYARSDKRHGRREPIMASMVALVAQTVGIDHFITIDLHSAQIEGFSKLRSISSPQCRSFAMRFATDCRRAPSWSHPTKDG